MTEVDLRFHLLALIKSVVISYVDLLGIDPTDSFCNLGLSWTFNDSSFSIINPLVWCAGVPNAHSTRGFVVKAKAQRKSRRCACVY